MVFHNECNVGVGSLLDRGKTSIDLVVTQAIQN